MFWIVGQFTGDTDSGFDSQPVQQSPPATRGDLDGARRWNEGGNLHKGTLLDWRNAKHRNKLATCADFIAADKRRAGKSSGNTDKLRVEAEELLRLIDKSVANSSDDSRAIATIAAECLVAEPEFTIINESTIPGTKRSLDIRLRERVSEARLREIALLLKGSDTASYDRTFICFYLPGMQVNAGAWATTHFNPSLDVRIQEYFATGIDPKGGKGSVPVDSGTKSNQNTVVASGKIIGRWKDSSVLFGEVTISTIDGETVFEHRFSNGKSLKRKLDVKRRTVFHRRTFWVRDSQHGDHYRINSKGDLEIRDKSGLIGTAVKIK